MLILLLGFVYISTYIEFCVDFAAVNTCIEFCVAVVLRIITNKKAGSHQESNPEHQSEKVGIYLNPREITQSWFYHTDLTLELKANFTLT